MMSSQTERYLGENRIFEARLPKLIHLYHEKERYAKRNKAILIRVPVAQERLSQILNSCSWMVPTIAIGAEKIWKAAER